MRLTRLSSRRGCSDNPRANLPSSNQAGVKFVFYLLGTCEKNKHIAMFCCRTAAIKLDSIARDQIFRIIPEIAERCDRADTLEIYFVERDAYFEYYFQDQLVDNLHVDKYVPGETVPHKDDEYEYCHLGLSDRAYKIVTLFERRVTYPSQGIGPPHNGVRYSIDTVIPYYPSADRNVYSMNPAIPLDALARQQIPTIFLEAGGAIPDRMEFYLSRGSAQCEYYLGSRVAKVVQFDRDDWSDNKDSFPKQDRDSFPGQAQENNHIDKLYEIVAMFEDRSDHPSEYPGRVACGSEPGGPYNYIRYSVEL